MKRKIQRKQSHNIPEDHRLRMQLRRQVQLSRVSDVSYEVRENRSRHWPPKE